MKKETVKIVEEEIQRKTTLPEKVKEKIRKEIYLNIVIAIIVILYFTFLISGSFGTAKITRQIDFKIFSMMLLGLAICLIEIGYKKESAKYAIFGIESLIFALYTLFFPYIIFEISGIEKVYFTTISIYIGIYYIVKSIIIYSKLKKSYNRQTSDINEIIKDNKAREDDENENVIKKHNLKDNNIAEKKEKKIIKANNKKEKVSKKEETNKKEEAKQESKTQKVDTVLKKSKRGRPRKNKEALEQRVEESEKAKKTDEVKKKRGRPRKVKEEITEEKVETKTAKRRGRPRKVVTSND